MALPPGITPKTVTVGVASFFDGTLARGTATITAPVNVVHNPSNRPLFSSQMAQAFVDGEATFVLCPTDAVGLNRRDWTYKLNVIITGALVQPDPIYFTLPEAGPDVIDLDALVPVPSSAGTPISVAVLTADDLDGYTAQYVGDADSQTRTALDALDLGGTSLVGANVGRFIKRAQAGDALKLVSLGDSVLEGTTVDNQATDDTMHLLPTDLATRFPASTFTMSNRAVSGRTTASSFTGGHVRDAIADKGDLYIIGFGKNDIGWDRVTATAHPVPGYPREASLAMLEQMVRLIRADVPKADIVIMAENPYSPISSSSNALLTTWSDGARRVAATYGCEFVDAYTPFAEAADLAALVPDGTHPGTAGHRLMADTILDHLPASYSGPTLSPGDPAAGGLYPQVTDTTTNLRGWRRLTAPAAGAWVNSGAGWSGTGPYATSTAGDYAEFTFTGTELLLTMSTAAADAPVVDVTVDGVPLYTGRSLTQGKQGPQYVVPIVTGLTPGAHTVRIAVASGTLRIHEAAHTVFGTGFTPTVAVVDLTSATGSASQTTTALDETGAIHYMVLDTQVSLPTGWSKMAVTFSGSVLARVGGPTTTDRLINVNLRINGAAEVILQQTSPPREADTDFVPFVIAHSKKDVAAPLTVRLEIRVQSPDKTRVSRGAWNLTALCQRLA